MTKKQRKRMLALQQIENTKRKEKPEGPRCAWCNGFGSVSWKPNPNQDGKPAPYHFEGNQNDCYALELIVAGCEVYEIHHTKGTSNQEDFKCKDQSTFSWP